MGMVRHMVVCCFKEGTTEETIADLLGQVHTLQEKIPGIQGVESGPYESPEGANQGYTHGFLVTFDSPAARDGYLSHPDHDVVRDALLAKLESVVAFDFEVK